MLFFKKKEIINERGFTILEAMITVAIIAIMSAVYLVDYRPTNQKIILDQAAAGVVSDLRYVQNMAMNVKKFNSEIPQGGYGINISNSYPVTTYTIFADCDNSHDYQSATTPCAGNTATEKVSNRALYSNINIASPSLENIVFQPPSPIVWINGATAASATVTLQYGLSGLTKTITINGYTGEISAN